MSRFFAVLLALVVGITTALTVVPAHADDFDVYTSEGTHTHNGRQWRTTCERYSQTQRCRTEIFATTVAQVGGRFVQRNGWVFNNLTYAASPRGMWEGNRLAAGGTVGGRATWKAADGRQWRTECDTAVTGGNGCRSYVEADVIESTSRGYAWTTTWILNNMVRFTTAGSQPPPAAPSSPSSGINVSGVADPNLRACLREATSVATISCAARGISSLAGFPALPGLTELDLYGNQITDVRPLQGLTGLRSLNLYDNQIRDVSPLASLRGLRWLYLGDNQISDVRALAGLTSLRGLDLSYNQVRDISRLAWLTSLELLELSSNQITDVSPVGALGNLESLYLHENQIAEVGSLAVLSGLRFLDLGGNRLSDISAVARLTGLRSLQADGNQLRDISSLRALVNLQSLNLSSNAISDVRSLAALSRLRQLDLSDNQVRDVSPLAGLTLESLHLEGNS